ncbi:hypothetical protein LDENG_00266960 [Lucifuga dentata]|nr:hypothetical protein LDENG_00266960 [Lucifuga dentata]
MSPAELLMGRRLRTTLPYTAKQKKHKKVRQKQKHLQKRQKMNYDKSSRSLVPLVRHDTVRLEDSNIWSRKATVLEEISPSSYTIRTEDGQILRSRRSLVKTRDTSRTDNEANPACTASAEPLPVPDDSRAAEQIHSSPVLRRSTRSIKAPDRLNL